MDEYEFKDQLKDAFLEEFDGIEDEDGDSNPDYVPDRYWQDAIMELADNAVPTDTDEMYELWMGLGRPEVDDTGLIEGVKDIDRIVAVAIYEFASDYLYELAGNYPTLHH